MNCEREKWASRSRLKQLFPCLESTPDINRGEQRFAAEVALAEFGGKAVPEIAIDRAVRTLKVMAVG